MSGDDLTTGQAYTVVFRQITNAIDDGLTRMIATPEVVDQLKALVLS
jgi:hypothetical protein